MSRRILWRVWWSCHTYHIPHIRNTSLSQIHSVRDEFHLPCREKSLWYLWELLQSWTGRLKELRENSQVHTVPVECSWNWGWSNQGVCSPSEIRRLTCVVSALILEWYLLCGYWVISKEATIWLVFRPLKEKRCEAGGLGNWHFFLLILCPWSHTAYWRLCISGVITVLCCWKETYKNCK